MPILSASVLLLATMYGLLLNPVPLGAALIELGETVMATLPDLALRHIASVALVIAAVCAALAEV